jgi:hypothetical protein
MNLSRNPSSDNFWSNSSKDSTTSIAVNKKNKDNNDPLSELLSSIDESSEFYDPYSDLNLFLSQKVKQEMQHCESSKKWSLKIQEDLIVKITPEFQKKFPQYRLGVSALKKTWEKIAYYSTQIQQKKEAMTQDGKLNIHFFIKENLKSYAALKNPIHIHPCHFAHQLAMKMSECIAVIDGIRPELKQLTKLIWAVQRHLLTGGIEQNKSPYDEYDKIDSLIVKSILEISAKDPQISFNELEHKVKESLLSLYELPNFSSLDHLQCNISALLAEKLYASSTFHTLFFSEQKNAIHHFMQRHTSLCKDAIPHPQLPELVRRIIALYTLASNLPKNISENIFKEAVHAIYPQQKEERPNFPQALYAFISAELVLMKSEEFCPAPTYVAETLWSAYQEATLLPILQGKDNDVLEIVIWKSLSKTEGLLQKLPYQIGQKIEEEIANIMIENPTHAFSALVQNTVQFFKRTKNLVQIKQWSEIEKRIHIWTLQGDMLCRWIRLDPDSILLRMICQKWKEHPAVLPHHTFVSEICQTYLKSYPELTLYSGQLALRVWILYKYAWYNLFGTREASSFDRFLKWHSCALLFSGPTLDHDHLVHQLEEIICKTIPLIPFDKKQVNTALTQNFSSVSKN